MMVLSKTSMRSHKRTNIVDLIVNIMDNPSPVRPQYSQQIRMSDARSSNLPSRSRCSTMYRTPVARSIGQPSTKHECGLRILDDEPSSWRSNERNDNVKVEDLEKRRLKVNTAANPGVQKGYNIPDKPPCYHAQTNRFNKNCPACRKLKQLEDLQRLQLRPPCKQKSDQKRGIAKRTSRHMNKCREKRSRRKKRHGNAARPCKSRPKPNNNKALRIKDSEDEVKHGRNTESGSNVSSSANVSSIEKIPSVNNSIPDHEPMDM